MSSKFSIPHSAALCGFEIFSVIVSELEQVNPDNSLAECLNSTKVSVIFAFCASVNTSIDLICQD